MKEPKEPKEPQTDEGGSRDMAALEKIMEALVPLPRESRQRILDTLAVFFSIRVLP